MPFGLTHTPATFQCIMNEVFQEYIGKFVLVFFDEILIYSKNETEHAQHLELVFKKLLENQLHVKRNKCTFSQNKIEYLGHIISNQGIAADDSKIVAMKAWPSPKNVKALRGFLGLTGYYRRFVRNYGKISKLLTNLLKKWAVRRLRMHFRC